METIWCVEDDKSIRDILLYTLKSTGFQCAGFERADSFFEALKKEQPDLVLLDIMLPETDGLQILEKLRSDPETASIPVIMTTAKGMEYDKIEALEAGADDYLVKPFGMMEMIARIRAVLRRVVKEDKPSVLSAGAIRLNPDSHRVFLNDQSIELTRKEYALLELFLKNPDRVFERDELFCKIWGEDFIGESRTVDVHIGSLRTKLKEEGKRIETIRGVGYRLSKAG